MGRARVLNKEWAALTTERQTQSTRSTQWNAEKRSFVWSNSPSDTLIIARA